MSVKFAFNERPTTKVYMLFLQPDQFDYGLITVFPPSSIIL